MCVIWRDTYLNRHRLGLVAEQGLRKHWLVLTWEILFSWQSYLCLFLIILMIYINSERKKSLQMASQTSFGVTNDWMRPFRDVTVILHETCLV